MRITLLRAAVLLGLLANLLYAAWSHGWFAFMGLAPNTQRDPSRVEQQFRPGGMRVLSPQAAASAVAPATAAAPAAPASGPAAAAASAPPAAEPVAMPASMPAPTSTAGETTNTTLACLELGPLDGGAIDSAERALEALLPAGSWTRDRRPGAAQYAVFVGPILSRDAARTRREELVKLKLSFEAIELPDSRDGRQGGYSLGLHDSQLAAQRALSSLRERGLKNASVVLARPAGTPRTWLRAEALTPAQAESLRALPTAAFAAGAAVGECLMGSAMSVGAPAR